MYGLQTPLRVVVRADVVRAELARRGISQNHLALRAALSRGYLSQLLKQERSPSPTVRVRLMEALRISDFDALFEVLP